jgi:hypothetical protein
MIIGLSFRGACAWIWKNFMRALEEFKATKELLVALDNIVRACFRLFFKLHQNSFLLLFAPFHVINSVLSKFDLSFFL